MILLFPNPEKAGTGYFVGFSCDKQRLFLIMFSAYINKKFIIFTKGKSGFLQEAISFLSVINASVTNITWKPGS